VEHESGGVHINTMTGSRQQKPRIGLTKCPDLVDHYSDTAHLQLLPFLLIDQREIGIGWEQGGTGFFYCS